MSESTPETPAEAPEQPAQVAEPKVFTEDYVKELRAEAAKYRTEAKQAKSEVEKVRKSSLSEAEQAVLEAEQRGRVQAITEFGGRLVDAEVRAASAGRGIDVDALLEGLDRSRFLTDDGEVDRKALVAWVDRIAPTPQEQAPQVPSFDGGVRTTHVPNSTAQQFAKAFESLI